MKKSWDGSSRDEYFQECLSLHIGSGSNLLFINDFNGIILHSQIKGISVVEETDDSVLLRIGAAEKWDDVVAYAVSKGWGGIENLSNIPGEARSCRYPEYRGVRYGNQGCGRDGGDV